MSTYIGFSIFFTYKKLFLFKQEVVFKLTHDDDLFYGQAIEVKLSAKNMSARNRRTVKAVTFYYHRQKYTGEQGKLLMKDAIPLEADLKPGESESNINPQSQMDFPTPFN